jgi:hypothetical protein
MIMIANGQDLGRAQATQTDTDRRADRRDQSNGDDARSALARLPSGR